MTEAIQAIKEWVVRINESCFVIPCSFPFPFYQLPLEVEPKSLKNLLQISLFVTLQLLLKNGMRYKIFRTRTRSDYR